MFFLINIIVCDLDEIFLIFHEAFVILLLFFELRVTAFFIAGNSGWIVSKARILKLFLFQLQFFFLNNPNLVCYGIDFKFLFFNSCIQSFYKQGFLIIGS